MKTTDNHNGHPVKSNPVSQHSRHGAWKDVSFERHRSPLTAAARRPITGLGAVAFLALLGPLPATAQVEEVVNEEGTTLVRTDPGERGIVAGTNWGTATATNHGTITTSGDPDDDNRSAFGIAAFTHWSSSADGGVARATNEATGTVTTRGRFATGAAAFSGRRSASGTAALAANHGSITTQGAGARGLLAWDRGPAAGRAEGENRGTITTSGQPSGTALSNGMEVWSPYNSAYAVNHEGATITASGRGARGVQVGSGYGSADESALAVNRGTVTTRGNGYHTDSSVYPASGVLAWSGAEASAVAVNAYEGVIETHGTGAVGLGGLAWRGGGEAYARNRGRITTRGDAHRVDRSGTDNDSWHPAYGIRAESGDSDATAVNEAGGVVETHGAVVTGIAARSSRGGTATAVNHGRVTTRGGAADDLPGSAGTLYGSRGVNAYSVHANAHVENGTTGRVDTHGERAFALYASTKGDGSRTSAMAEVVNRGVVHTRGNNADAVLAGASHGGTADNPNHARAINAAGATITTVGDGSSGLGAFIQLLGDDSGTGVATDVHGTAHARNDGTVVTGEVDESNFEAGVFAANGVGAAFFSYEETIGNAGDVTVINTGDVTVKHENASGLYAETHGSGMATVQVMGGSVSAEHESGRGLWARTGATGEVHVTISGGARIAASSAEGIAAEFEGGTTDVRLLDSILDGRAVFGSGTDTFTIRSGWVTGAVDFGTGTDTLSVHGDTWLDGAVSNLETLHKRGSGTLVMRSDATFSSGGSAVLENGGLAFSGQFNLGTTGTMRIHDAARLTAVLADASAPPRITAGGGITFDGDEELFLQVTPEISLTSEQTYLTQLSTATGNPIANGTPVTGRTGQVALRTARGPSTVVDVGHIPLVTGATQATGTVVTTGVRLGVFNLDAPEDFADLTVLPLTEEVPTTPLTSPSEPSLELSGATSGFGAALLSLFESETLDFAQDDEARASETLTMPAFVESRAQDGALEYWARSWAGDAPTLAGGIEATVRGAAFGVDLPISKRFRLGVSTTPALSVSSGASTAGARLEGARYAAWSSWRGEVFHAGASASHGRYRAQSVLDNPVAGGALASELDLTQDHIQLGAGARLRWSGVQLAPSLSVFSGSLHQGAHTAEGSVFRAKVPAFSQRYSGWKSELTLSARNWLRGPESLQWRPALHLYTQRTDTTGPASMEVTQQDRAGVLSLTSSAQATGLPRNVHGFAATVDALRSADWRVQLGFAGMHSDGEYEQMVLARLQRRF